MELRKELQEIGYDGMVKITVAHYIELLYAEEKLAMLEAGGVDNWTWYDESLYGGNIERRYPDCEVCHSQYFACTCDND